MKLSNGLELTAEQESNLRRLAYYHLRGIECSPMGFTMSWYCSQVIPGYGQVTPDPWESPCGTVGCLLGHGVLAGIDAFPSEDWHDYSCRAFMPPSESGWSPPEWDWCFEAAWCATDNTPRGGGKRILWLFEFGLPPDWEDQMRGLAPLCYADWSPDLPAEIAEQVPQAVHA